MSVWLMPLRWPASAIWLWLALVLLVPPSGARADGTAGEPPGPALIAAAGDSESVEANAPTPVDAEAVLRQARRLLIDLPGGDPLSMRTNDMLLFGPGPDGEKSGGGGSQSTKSAGASAGNLPPELLALCKKVRTALAMYYPRHQNSRDNSPWEVMHAIVAYGVDTQIFKGGPGGEKVNAIGYMSYNYPCRGQRMLFLNRGKVDANRGVGLQGHAGQFLAILAQSHLRSDYPLRVEGKDFTLADLIQQEKETCVAGTELTFKLIALMHYLDCDETWTAPDGQTWSIQRLVHEELKQPIRGAACGGTHRLMGFSYAVNKRLQRHKPIEGEFRRAQIFIQDYHRYTFGLQNPDGSFSTAWFERRGDNPDIDRRLKTSGHILEWIAFSLSDDELRDPRMIKAVDYLSTLLLTHNKRNWEIGPLGHGLHALAIYENRVFKDVVPMPPAPVAGGTSAAPEREARRADAFVE